MQAPDSGHSRMPSEFPGLALGGEHRRIRDRNRGATAFTDRAQAEGVGEKARAPAIRAPASWGAATGIA